MDEGGENLLGRKLEEIFSDEEVLIHIGGGVFDESLVLVGNEKDSDGGIVGRFTDFHSVVVQVSIELSGIFMGEGSDLEFNENVALQDTVVKHEIDEEVVFTDEQAFLASFKAEAVAELEEEVLQVIEQGGFEIAFFDRKVGGQAEELKTVDVLG